MTALVDVRSTAQIDAAVRHALDTFGRIDILINNAARAAGRRSRGRRRAHRGRLGHRARRQPQGRVPHLARSLARCSSARCEVAAFLVSGGAEYVTGQAINVAGGAVMH